VEKDNLDITDEMDLDELSLMSEDLLDDLGSQSKTDRNIRIRRMLEAQREERELAASLADFYDY
jgi:hypothetical protein